jgi:ABC-type nickel/cobalt efflux system permease component RcnA
MRVAMAFVATALVVTFGLGLLVNAFLPASTLPTGPSHEEITSPWNWICAGLLCLLTLWVLVRAGPRGFLSQLSQGGEPHVHPEPGPAASGHDAEHEHEDGHGCRDSH